jgi:hypothetical protein
VRDSCTAQVLQLGRPLLLLLLLLLLLYLVSTPTPAPPARHDVTCMLAHTQRSSQTQAVCLRGVVEMTVARGGGPVAVFQFAYISVNELQDMCEI